MPLFLLNRQLILVILRRARNWGVSKFLLFVHSHACRFFIGRKAGVYFRSCKGKLFLPNSFLWEVNKFRVYELTIVLLVFRLRGDLRFLWTLVFQLVVLLGGKERLDVALRQYKGVVFFIFFFDDFNGILKNLILSFLDCFFYFVPAHTRFPNWVNEWSYDYFEILYESMGWSDEWRFEFYFFLVAWLQFVEFLDGKQDFAVNYLNQRLLECCKVTVLFYFRKDISEVGVYLCIT